ncbi:LysM peptidoglycan-binding domain-containing protein [Methylosinus sp. H3A]|uniref:LysM peptidoglycan-binding domain-containing protein n=1 Tax=Methylosinus sp. H3A TaxID=2785786 RepID=UPI0018C24CAF|nr:LysM domain-containing protein [Methylosinus sp. H3A]MBG0810451.1 LysM peptidoglycan-binding domain-containing protein [Methylosinus sp. H3A]
MYAASGLLSAPFSAVWIVALAAVLAFHCRHIAQGCRECRWFHSTHIAMAIGMVYMFGASAFGWDLVSSSVWTALYVAIAAAILVLIAYQLLRHGSFDFLWALALIQQGAMIYMWAPMNYWKPWVSYGLAVYFALEAIAWPLGLCSAQSLARVGAVVSGGGGSLAIAGFERRSPLVENFCMTVMAASMGYMFVGMQLLMSMPTMSTPPAMATAEPERPSIAPKEATLQQAQPLQAAPERAAADATSSYRIVAGDTLARIALRHYGDAGKWRDLVKANPGLDPRRMTVGATIALPKMGAVPASGP